MVSREGRNAKRRKLHCGGFSCAASARHPLRAWVAELRDFEGQGEGTGLACGVWGVTVVEYKRLMGLGFLEAYGAGCSPHGS